MEVRTWEDVAAKIAAMTPEQRKQPIQCANSEGRYDEVLELRPGFAMATVGELGLSKCRSVYDNKYHAEDVVLVLDYNPFDPDGTIAFDWLLDGQGNGKDVPVYGKDGPTPPESQYSPEVLSGEEPMPVYVLFARSAKAEVARSEDTGSAADSPWIE